MATTNQIQQNQEKSAGEQEKKEAESTIQEQISAKQKLEKQYQKVVKEQSVKEKVAKEQKLAEELSDSTWGQLDVYQTFAKDTVTKAQGYEDPEPVEEVKVKAPPPRKLTPKEQEEKEAEKMRLFSEFVAADAEASTPVEKKPDPMEAPLHFKYYQNDGDDASLVEQTADEILGGESKQVTKGKVNLKYDHSDPEWHVEPIAPVDYSKT